MGENLYGRELRRNVTNLVVRIVLGDQVDLTARTMFVHLKRVGKPRTKYSGVFGHIIFSIWYECCAIDEAVELLSSGRGVFDRAFEFVGHSRWTLALSVDDCGNRESCRMEVWTLLFVVSVMFFCWYQVCLLISIGRRSGFSLFVRKMCRLWRVCIIVVSRYTLTRSCGPSHCLLPMRYTKIYVPPGRCWSSLMFSDGFGLWPCDMPKFSLRFF